VTYIDRVEARECRSSDVTPTRVSSCESAWANSVAQRYQLGEVKRQVEEGQQGEMVVRTVFEDGKTHDWIVPVEFGKQGKRR
jgi:hypothetical protein